MAPPPMTTAEPGRADNERTSSEVSTWRPSTSKPGSVLGTEPAARMMFVPLICWVAPSGAGHLDDMVAEKAPRPGKDLVLALLHEPGQATVELVDDLLLAVLARGELDGRLARLDAELLCSGDSAEDGGSLEELLCRDAAAVKARPADLVLLHDRDRQPGSSGVERSGVSARAPTDHDDVEGRGRT